MKKSLILSFFLFNTYLYGQIRHDICDKIVIGDFKCINCISAHQGLSNSMRTAVASHLNLDYTFCEVLNRDKLAAILSRKNNEELISSINDLTTDEKLKLTNVVRAQRVLFGEMEVQTDNSLLVTLIINNLGTGVQETTSIFEIPKGSYDVHSQREPYVNKGIERMLLGKTEGKFPNSTDGTRNNEATKPIILYDLSGTWAATNGQKSEWVQDGSDAYAIYNGQQFKHYIKGHYTSSNKISGTMMRVDLNNNCLTTTNLEIDILSDRSFKITWIGLDNNCDLVIGQSGSDVLNRVSRPNNSPMNEFGGTLFNPTNDMTGSWGENGECGDWFEHKGLVVSIHNNPGFKHYFIGNKMGMKIVGKTCRINRANGCKTTMEQTFTVGGSNRMSYVWTSIDGNCDLSNGQVGQGGVIRCK